MLLAGIPANSTYCLRELSHAYYAFQSWWMASMIPWNLLLDVFLAGDGATGREDGCSGLERPLTPFELDKNA